MSNPAETIIDAWTESFGTSPSNIGELALARLSKNNPTEIVLDAIRVTVAKFQITSETDRIKYISGILRNKRIAKVFPDKAAERYERNKAKMILRGHWKRQPHGTGYLNDRLVEEWLTVCSVDEIKAVMDVAEGYWARLREEMGRVVKNR
jgi:hypothetical protein